jgi:DNA ligase (NAD+)
MSQARTHQIADLLSKADDAYYGTGTPLMSDPQYDKLTDELRALDPTHPQLNKVGGKAALASSGWQKVPHGQPMASLNKAQVLEDFRKWAASCAHKGGQVLIIMDKLDGASLSLQYENGHFIQAVTRGDGTQGEDITVNAKLMQGVVKVFPGFTGYLRGEVVCLHDDFQVYFPGQSNPRSTANGTMKRQSDADGCKHLTVIMFGMSPDVGALPSKSAEFAALKKAGFILPRYEVVKTRTEVESIYQLYVDTLRAKLNYDIDGLVIQFDDEAAMDALGSQGRGPKGAVAFKFPHEEKETILRDVVWQVGKSGRVTPVAVFDLVNLGGANVDRASLATANRVAYLKLYPGCRILVCRRNDVIPRLEANLSEQIIND